MLIPLFANWYQMYQEAPWLGAGLFLLAMLAMGVVVFAVVMVGCAVTYGPVAAVAAWLTRAKPASAEANSWFFNEPAA